jgi:hypothetical protein
MSSPAARSGPGQPIARVEFKRMMKDRKFFTCHCEHCRGPIEFPADSIGTTVACPHCANQTELTLPPLEREPIESPRARLWAIGGVLVLLALLAAAFYALHRAKQIRARAERALAKPVSITASSNADLAKFNAPASITLIGSGHACVHPVET